MHYLTSKYFTESFTSEEIHKFNQNWEADKWDFAKSFVSPSNPISKMAVKISERMKKDFDFDIFPLIITIGRKGYRSSGGSFFMMRGQK